MITVRAILQTEQILHNALTALLIVPYIGEEAEFELGCVEFAMSLWEGIDETLNSPGGVGWDVLTGLDSFNQGIKQSFPYLLEYEATNYANLNGADRWPYAWVFPGKSGGLPVFPLARGPRNLLVTKAQECALRMFGPLRWMATAATFCGPISIFLGAMFINVRIDRNIQSLLGHSVFYDRFITGWGDIVKEILEEVLHIKLGPFSDLLGFLGNLAGSIPLIDPPLTPSLQWEADVRPMLLTDEPDAELTENESPNLVKVHEYLQLLAVALGKSQRASPIGGEKFANPDLLPRITYAQADVYNPTRWDMFTQDWRAKLTRARLLDVKCRELGQKIGVGSLCGQGWSFVNTH